MSVSIIIPTWNGLALLQKHLPALLAADGVGQAEIIIVDDGGGDETGAWLAAHVPQVRVIRLETNSGFSRACNAGLRAAQGEWVVLLNNDVHVTPGFLAPLVRPLEADPDVFAVNAAILIPGKDMLDEGQKHGAFHHGLFYVDCMHAPALRATQTAPTLYATACAAAYRRTMLDMLGGFDELFSPAYWEDVDLSYRALKRGWRVLYEPESIVHHEHESTTARLDRRFLAMVRQRNHFFFVWKNIGDRRWLAASLLLAPWVGVYHALRGGDTSLLRGLGAALRDVRRVLARRREEQASARVSDRAVLAGAREEALTPQPPLPQAGEGEQDENNYAGTSKPNAYTLNPRPLLHWQARRGGRGTGAQRQGEGLFRRRTAGRMNILVVSAWCPYPADNGSRLRAYNLIRELAGQGHALTLIALGQDDSDLAGGQEPLEQLCTGGVTLFPSRFFQSGTWRATLGFFSPKPRMLLDTFQPDAARAIAKECRSAGYDVILTLEVGIAHYIPNDAAAPCVLDQVEVSSFVREARESASLRKRLRLGLMVAKFRAHVASLAPRFACWTAVSARERDAIIHLIGPRAAPIIHVLPNGVDLEHNAPDWENKYDPNAVIYNGALSFYANRQAVEHFAGDILPLIQRKRPQAHLRVTGKTDTLAPDDPLRSHPSVTLTGYVQDIRPVVQSAAVCVVPLRQGGGTRLKILEAMALGVPVVATPQAAEGINAVSGEHMVVADAPQAFADATLRLMDSSEERTRIAQGGRQLVEAQYGWRALGTQLAHILQGQAAKSRRN